MKLLVSLCYGWFWFFTCFNITLFILLKNNPLKSAFNVKNPEFLKELKPATEQDKCGTACLHPFEADTEVLLTNMYKWY